MRNNKKEFKILRWLIKDEFNHEFAPLMNEIQRKLNINIPKIPLFFMLIVYQYAFAFLLLLILYKIQGMAIFAVIFALVMLFNFILPATIARTSAARIEENPMFDCLRLSDLEKQKTRFIIMIAELISFWIHNFSIELISIWLFCIKFKVPGIFMGIAWVVVVSAVFFITLLRHQDMRFIGSNGIVSYLFSLGFTGYITYKIFRIFIGTLNKISIEEFFAPKGLSLYTKSYINHIISTLVPELYNALFVVLIFGGVFLIVRFIIHKSEKTDLERKRDRICSKYVNLLLKTTKNPWVRRDIRQIFRITSKLDINNFMIIIPSGIVFMTVIYVMYFLSHESIDAIIIASNFILWVTVYQFANFLVQKIPIFHISSELRNVELIVMSDRQIDELIRAKHLLLGLLCSPILLVVWAGKIMLAINGENLIVIVSSLIIDAVIFGMCMMLTLKWTFILPKFSWENIFMLKQDNFDQQILQQFLMVPNRIVTIYFGISFLIVNVVRIDYSISFVLLYYVLSLMGLTIMFLLLKRGKKNGINVYN